MRPALVLGVVVLAGCGSTAAKTSTTQHGPVAFARCMRSHGVASWPDPNSLGVFDKSKLTPVALHIGDSEVNAAKKACLSLDPGAFSRPTQAQVQQYRNAMLVYAKCIRAHGVPNMPDPDARGHLDIGPGTAIDVNSPKFEEAYQACKSKLQP